MTTNGFDAHAAHSAHGDNDDDDEFDVHCYCKSKDQDTMLIKCDHCHTTYHGPCVGINTESDVPVDEWFCDACILGKIAAREASHCKEDDVDYIDRDFAMHQTFQAVIAHRLGTDNLEDAIHLHLARWIDELEEKGLMNDNIKGRPRRVVSRLLEHWDTRGPAAESLSEEGSCRVILALFASTSVLMKSFRSQIGFLIKLMTDESSHMLRKLSLKVIEKTVEGDPNMMLLPLINKAVSRRLKDESISVREAAVSLIGSYAVKSPFLANAYHDALVGCFADPGVSVRKRSVRIFQQILVQNPRYRGRSMVCNIMLERAADPKEEDAVRDLVEDLFCELWLRSSTKKNSSASAITVVTDSDSSVPIAIESTPGVVTPTSPSPATKRRTMNQADIAAEQMMEIVRAAGSADNLEALLRKLLKGSANADGNKKISERAKHQELGMKQCTELVNALFELLLVVEEQREIRGCVGKDIASTLLAISVFAKLSPHSILPSYHLESLLVYLKADNGVGIEDEAAIICATCEVLVWCSPLFDLNFVNKLAKTSLCKDLVAICKKFGVKVIASAIRVFASLAFHPVVDLSASFFSKKLLDLAKMFYSYLCTKEAVEDFSLGDSKQKYSVHRALTVLGLICENHTHVTIDPLAWGSEVSIENAPLISEENLSWDNFTCACYRLFTRFLRKQDILTKCKALAALKGIFVAQPQLLLQLDHVGLFDEVMADSAGVPLQLEALECWRNILTAEEKRVDSGEAEAKMDASDNITVREKISGDQDGDATLFGGVLTSHSNRLYEMIHSRNSDIRYSTLKLISILLRQGLLNPNEVVPHLFALQGDIEQNAIRSLALDLLMAEAEKRPDTLRQRVGAGVKQAYKFQRTIYSKKLHVSALVTRGTGKNVEVESIFNSVFSECIMSNKKQREGLYRSLLSLFEIDDQIVVTSMDLSLLSFAAQILAHLPYNNNSDLLFIIHSITTILTIAGYQTVDRMSDFLRLYGLANDDEFSDSLACEDLLELAAAKKFPSRAKEAQSVSSSFFDTERFCNLLREASSWVLLLRLKQFLRVNYNLSLSRCLNYEPGHKEKPNDKFGCKKLFESFDSSMPSCLLGKGGDIDRDALIRHYAAFRRMMRDETGAASTSPSHEDDEGELEVHFTDNDEADEKEEKSPAEQRPGKRKIELQSENQHKTNRAGKNKKPPRRRSKGESHSD
jgi:cohesin loading factor subunit SCC2